VSVALTVVGCWPGQLLHRDNSIASGPDTADLASSFCKPVLIEPTTAACQTELLLLLAVLL
jgi:hypothetical protein